MEKLNTIQKRNKLNEVWSLDGPGAGGACHDYLVIKEGSFDPSREGPAREDDVVGRIVFQHGPRKEPGSTPGVLDVDLLEIVRDRLQAFQRSAYATNENVFALMHIEEALLWMNKRVEDRAEKGILGTDKVDGSDEVSRPDEKPAEELEIIRNPAAVIPERYICNRDFTLNKMDEDGALIENVKTMIHAGEVYERVVDPKDGDMIRLRRRDRWMMITEETLKACFDLYLGEETEAAPSEEK